MNLSLLGTGRAALILMALLAGLTVSCASSQVEKAFSGSLSKADATKSITEYCQSCHLHRNFDGEKHVAEARLKYNKEPFKTTTDCQTCHSYSVDFWGEGFRATYYPEGKLTGEPSIGKK